MKICRQWFGKAYSNFSLLSVLFPTLYFPAFQEQVRADFQVKSKRDTVCYQEID